MYTDVIDRFLSAADAERASRTLSKLARHDTSRWALTGGLAIEIHRLRRGRQPSMRALNDIDFMADAFDCIPETLATHFLFRHIHPLDPPGKTMLQSIDPDCAVRVDVFRAYGAIMSRTVRLNLPSGPIQLVSVEDLIARTARLVLDLAENVPVPSKHAHDYPRLVELVKIAKVEAAWQDHRKLNHPLTFHETNRRLQDLIPARSDLLVTPEYSKDIAALCPRCMSTAAFQLAEPHQVLSLLGYC